jgi:hypothetical protein
MSLVSAGFSSGFAANVAVAVAALGFTAPAATLRAEPAVPLVDAAPRFAGVLDDVAACGGVDLAFDKLAAVGLLSRSATSDESTAFFTGNGGTSGALRAFARDAAVGANRPDDEGVFGRATEEEEGVFGRAAEGVLARAGVTGGRTDALDDGRGDVKGLTFFRFVAVRSVGMGGVDVDVEIEDEP